MIRHADVQVSRHPDVVAAKQRFRSSGHGQAKVEGKPHVRNAELVREPDDGTENGRRHMRVLVRIEMSRAYADSKNSFDLRAQLGVGIQPITRERDHDIAQRLRQRLASEDRSALNEHKMAANVERRSAARPRDCVFEGIAIRHQRCRREDTVNMCLYDSGIHVRREAEVVGIDNQTLQSLEDSKMNGEILLRIGSEGLQSFI